MANLETPTIYGSAHTHSLYDGGGMELLGVGNAAMATAGGFAPTSTSASPLQQMNMLGGEVIRQGGPPMRPVQKLKKEKTTMAEIKRRYVQIFLADPDPRVPIDQCVLHITEPKMTDLTDQELFYEIEIKRLLDTYNETVRTKVIDKTIKDRTAYLEPARIRDLAMNVTTIAQFG